MKKKREWLIKARESRGLMVMETAREIGVSPANYHHYETGRTNLSLLLADKISKLFDIPIHTIVEYEKERVL